MGENSCFPVCFSASPLCVCHPTDVVVRAQRGGRREEERSIDRETSRERKLERRERRFCSRESGCWCSACACAARAEAKGRKRS